MIFKKKISIYLIFMSTLFVGLMLGENSSGGAKIDYEYLIPFVKNFSINFTTGLNSFISNSGSIIHSPVFYILVGYFLKITKSILFIKIFYILISSIIPYIFYLILKNKYKIQNDYIFLFSLLIFFSSYFRTSAIWILGDNLSLLFFSLSVLFFLKTKFEKSKVLNFYLCIIFLIFCCYIRYYYFLFSIYFLFVFYKNVNFRFFMKLILVGFLLSLPALIYFYYIILNYDFLNTVSNYKNFNYYSNTLIILSIFLFYFIPFIFFQFLSIVNYYKKNYKIILILLFPFLLILLLDIFFFSNLINFSNIGGGVFLKISYLMNFNSSVFLSIASFISLIFIDYSFKKNRIENYLLLIILVLCFPMITIFQKYLDPLFFIFFFGLINSDFFRDILIKRSVSILFLYGYFFSFLLFSTFYYL